MATNPYAGQSVDQIKSGLIASGMSADEAGGRAADIYGGAWGGPYPTATSKQTAQTTPKPTADMSQLPSLPTPAVMPTLPAPDLTSLEQVSTKESLQGYLDMFQEAVAKAQETIPEVRVPTMEEISAQVTPTTAAPALLNRAETRAGLITQYGVADLETALTQLNADEKALYAQFRQQRGLEEGKPVALGVISGRITEEERQLTERIDVITRQKAQITDELNTKYNIINTYMTDIGLDYNDAVAKYDKDYANNLKMYDIISGKESESIAQQTTNAQMKIEGLYKGVETYYKERSQQLAEAGFKWEVTKDQWDAATTQVRDSWNMSMDVWNARMDEFKTKWGMEKDVWDMGMEEQKLFLQEEQMRLDEKARVETAARANLTTYANLVTGGNLNVNNLSSDQKLLLSKLEVQAGFQPGFVSSLEMSAKDKILFTTSNEGITQVGIQDASGNISVKSYGTRITSTGSASDTKALRENFGNDATTGAGYSFPDLVEKYASTMSLDDIYTAYSNSEMGKSHGVPGESSQVIRLVYKVARGEMTEQEAKDELEGI